MSDCCFCSTLVSDELNGSWNKPLFESANFAVLPSLGSLVEGWVLIVPKKHFICTGALPINLVREMNSLKADVCARLGFLYGELCAFEHGPSVAARSVGCGVDHAHLHIVPLRVDLVSAAAPFLPEGISWLPVDSGSCRVAFEKGHDYLYVEQPIGSSGLIATHPNFGSQVFRKAIASSLGIPEHFSWREHPQIQIVERTIRTLGTFCEASL